MPLATPMVQGQLLGETPFETEIPAWGYYRVRAVKEGFAPVEQTYFRAGHRHARTDPAYRARDAAGMVWVPARTSTAPAPAVDLPGYWMDTYEVSNRAVQGIRRRRGIHEEGVLEARVHEGRPRDSWQEAMDEFRDATRRPGPAGWQLGTFPEGADELPVGGVSWYEAAAYAEFTGKSLPTVYEWYAAADGAGGISDILPLSNFGGRGPPRGEPSRNGPFRKLRHGRQPEGMGRQQPRRPALPARRLLGRAGIRLQSIRCETALFREPTVGFRLVRRETPPPAETFAPVRLGPRDAPRSQPVDDQAFQIFLRQHTYDKTELDAKMDRVVELPNSRRETVTFRAAYGNERVIAHLFLPNNATPPYQIVAFFGHSGILATRRIEDLQLPYEFVVRSGRALIIPAYSGSLERGTSSAHLSPVQTRERALKWSMDLGRSIDYLETRTDIDTTKLAYYGVSMGAAEGPRLVAVDPRFKTAVLATGGLRDGRPPEADAFNFAPRVHIPVLMLNGRDDFIFPVETHQKPLFEALGTQKPDKVFRQYDGGHANFLTRPDLIGEILDWLDKYIGPVDLRAARR